MPSPKPIKPTKLDFFDALRAVYTGMAIIKLSWSDKNTYLQLREARLKIHDDKGWHDLIISEADMAGDDWVIIDLMERKIL